MNNKTRIVGGPMALLSAAAIASWMAQAARAAYTFDTANSILTLKHIEDDGAAIPNIASDPIPGTSIPSAAPTNFQFTHTFSQTTGTGSSSTNDVSAVYQQTSATNLNLVAKSGTGVKQTNVPGMAYTGASVMDISADVRWNLGATGFPSPGHFPGLSYNYPIGGTLGILGHAEFVVNLNFFDTAIGAVPIGNITIDKIYNNPSASASLPFTDIIVGSALLNFGVPLPANSSLRMVGTIDLKATNLGSPTDISFQQDGDFGGFDSATNNLPEPGSASLMILGGAGLLRRRRRPKI